MARVGRNREKHKRLPKGWGYGPARKDGVRTIYFKPTNAGDRAIVKAITGKALSLRLGETMDEASTTYAGRIVHARARDEAAEPGTVGEICHRARLELLPSIENAKTREERARHIDTLEELYGKKQYARNVYEASRDTAWIFFRAMDAQRHLSQFRGKRGAVSANRRVRSWEVAFMWARAPWGLTEYNPCSGLQMNPETPRDVLPEDGDIFELYRALDPPARFMVALNRYYGRRKIEALGLTLRSDQPDGLHMMRGKRQREIVLVWDARLRRMWARLMLWRAKVKRGGKVETIAAMLNRNGGAYTVSGFNSARRRAMERAGLKGKFTFHDIRAARASSLSREKAAEVLAHDDPRTTNRVYRRGPLVIALDSEKPVRNSEKKRG